MPLPAPTGRFEAWIDLSWRGLGSRKDVAHRRLLIATTFALILMIGVVDYITGYEFSLQVFYLMPICLAVATAGWRFGVEASVASTAMWLARDLAAGAHFAGPVVSVWNALIALSTYLMVVWLLSSLITVHGEMENRVSQRTSALTDEIAERERLEKSILEISEREGLAFALQEFASTASQHFHVVCVCRCNGEVELEANGTATHLYRIAQEAVRNGARHGHAKRIEIALASREGSLALSVRDDGIGLPPEGVRGQGLGLRIMTHRAEIIGATLGISAQPAGGTLVVCRLPHP
jgi:signal transduction histidine kinase